MARYSITIKREDAEKRLDVAIFAADLGFSRRKIKSIIDTGGVYLNSKRVRMASRIVEAGDKVVIEYDPVALSSLRQENFEFVAKDILFFDKDIVAVNKMPGLPAQETSSQSLIHLKTCLASYLKNIGVPHREIHLVHRLDKETSGITLVALNRKKADFLMEQFREKKIDKTYHAICYSIPKREKFVVENRLSAIQKDTGLVHTVKYGGRQAKTCFDLLDRNDELGVSFISCQPLTGRSHQIRVHLADLGLPIIGDKKYGNQTNIQLPGDLKSLIGRHHFLHAHSLGFLLEKDSSKKIKLMADYPENFRKFLELCFKKKMTF